MMLCQGTDPDSRIKKRPYNLVSSLEVINHCLVSIRTQYFVVSCVLFRCLPGDTPYTLKVGLGAAFLHPSLAEQEADDNHNESSDNFNKSH